MLTAIVGDLGRFTYKFFQKHIFSPHIDSVNIPSPDVHQLASINTVKDLGIYIWKNTG